MPKNEGSKGQLKGSSSGGYIMSPPEEKTTLKDIGIKKHESARKQIYKYSKVLSSYMVLRFPASKDKKENEELADQAIKEWERLEKKEKKKGYDIV